MTSFLSFEDLLSAISTHQVTNDEFSHVVQIGPFSYVFHYEKQNITGTTWLAHTSVEIVEIGYRHAIRQWLAYVKGPDQVILLHKINIDEMVSQTRHDIFPFYSPDSAMQKKIERLKRDYIRANSLIGLLHMFHHDRAEPRLTKITS